SNFQMFFSSTDPDLRGVGQGGKVGRSDGKDIFFTDANGVKLSHELVSYDGTAGKVLAWVQAPSVSPSKDTTLYVYFGNASSADQQNIAGTWDANYQGVWHCAGSNSSTLPDSTSNGRGLSNHSASLTSSPLGGGINLNGASQYANASLDGSQ